MVPEKEELEYNERNSNDMEVKTTVQNSQAREKGRRKKRSFPTSTFEDVLQVAAGIQEHASGQKIRRVTLFNQFGKSPDSGSTGQLLTNSAKYGLTKGSVNAEYIELTPIGDQATSPDVRSEDQLRARFKLAIEGVPPFKALYDNFKGMKLPSHAVLHDFLVEKGFNSDEAIECVDTFIVNAKYLGLLQMISGAERLLTIDHAVENLGDEHEPTADESNAYTDTTITGQGTSSEKVTDDWLQTCFYITPIGEPETEIRQHADLFLNSIIEPALKEFGLQVVRADQIGKPGIITAQIIEYVVKSALVVADLSFHNPNVFYELALRHACGRPTVQIIRTADRIPFDLGQLRTIQIDTSSIYTLVPRLETYKSEIANQVRRALDSSETVSSPLAVYFPSLKVSY